MSDFITNFIEYRNLYGNFKNNTLKFLKTIEKTDAYIGGEYIITILNKNRPKFVKNIIYMTLFIHWSNFLPFIILNIDDIVNVNLHFETIYTNTFLYVKIVTRYNFQYIIYIVPDDIDIVEYIKNKSITTLSEVWFYKNTLKGTNLVLSMENKGNLKKKYLNLFIDNLDNNIINTLKKYQAYGFKITINTANYTKTEQIEYKNKEEISILTFLIFFHKNFRMLEYFYNEVIKKKYSNLAAFRHNFLLFNNINFILAISSNNTFNLDSLKDIFYNIRRDNYSKLITIIEELMEEYEDDYHYKHIVNYLKDLVEKIKT